RRGAHDVRRCAAPARARARARRSPVRQRLKGDEHRGGTPRGRVVRRAAAPHSRRLAQGRGLQRVRARAAAERRVRLSDRRDERRARRRTRRSGTRLLAGRGPGDGARARACRRAARRRRAALAGDRELRPVRQLRASRRHVPTARAGAAMSPRKKPHTLERQLLLLVPLALTAFGLVMVYSATSAPAALGNGNPVAYLERQAIYAFLGICLMVAAARSDYRKLRNVAPGLVVTALVLCLAVLAVGERVNGARRWIGFGPAAFQPSELAKLAVLVWCAAYLAR